MPELLDRCGIDPGVRSEVALDIGRDGSVSGEQHQAGAYTNGCQWSDVPSAEPKFVPSLPQMAAEPRKPVQQRPHFASPNPSGTSASSRPLRSAPAAAVRSSGCRVSKRCTG